MPATGQAVGACRGDPRLQPRVHRRLGRQPRAAGDPVGLLDHVQRVAYVWTFRWLVVICGMLAVGSGLIAWRFRSEEHTSELQSLMRISYAAFCLKKKKHTQH